MRVNDIEIRPLNSADLDLVSGLYHSIWHETHAVLQDPRIARSRDLAFFKSRLWHWQDCTRIACVDSEHVGLACWEGPVLEALYIAPNFRSSGIGVKLLAAVEAEMRQSGAKELSLQCLCANISGRRFYESNGWRVLKTTAVPDGIHKDIVTQHWAMVK